MTDKEAKPSGALATLAALAATRTHHDDSDSSPRCLYIDEEGEPHAARLVGGDEKTGFDVYVCTTASYAYGVGLPSKGKHGVKPA